jgi:hypothetical protein
MPLRLSWFCGVDENKAAWRGSLPHIKNFTGNMRIRSLNLSQLLALWAGGGIRDAQHAWSGSRDGFVICGQEVIQVSEAIPEEFCAVLIGAQSLASQNGHCSPAAPWTGRMNGSSASTATSQLPKGGEGGTGRRRGAQGKCGAQSARRGLLHTWRF